ncbi:MAG: hypothetical protein A2X86_03825 [Bdellovibrionales bacterium GWA2_49_15]|nr:MAG: hypothetical protein A2X86_03825 [Bdellovibrionales bacterium GWA2_49_15]HAZ12346.1 hypothetical protein [Bdellovibrionales bacterium]
MSRSLISTTFKRLILACFCLSIQLGHAATEANESLYGYLTKFQGEVYASSNWYVNASMISEKIGTVLLEDFADSKFELDGNKLMLTLRREGVRVEVGTIDESVIAGLVEGERVLVQTQNNVKLALIAKKSRPSFGLGWGCGITGCDFKPHAEIKRTFLLELSLGDGQVLCVNQGYQSDRAKFTSGKCAK